MNVPDWADPKLSQDLPVLRARGENQEIEYMGSFPQNVRELGKEIAAFASSNQGTILIGVSDDGDLIGLENALSVEGRDELLRRIEGICRGTIKPSITPTVKFAVEDGRTVLILLIPKGSQPVYYSNHIPYVRHITESRPAEPHEVVDLVRAWLPATGIDGEEPEPLSQLLSQLALTLINVLIYADESNDRSVNPWIDLWRAQFQQAASDLRELAIQDIAIQENLSGELHSLAGTLDEVTNFRLYMGCGPKLEALVSKASEMAKKLKIERVDPIHVSEKSLSNVASLIVSSSRRLKNLKDRTNEMVEQGRIEELQSEASDIGYTLLRISHYKIDSLQEGLSQKLRTLGKELHLIETMETYADGGISLRNIINKVEKFSNQLLEVEESLKCFSTETEEKGDGCTSSIIW